MSKSGKAVALKYTPGLEAPFLVAKGKGELAAKILRIAEECGVEIVQEASLSESLFECDIGTFIPEEMYEIIAQLLAYVMKVRKMR